jgi:predicted nucleic acid-binding protein
MIAIFDTNVLLRYANPSDVAHSIVISAVKVLQSLGVQLHIVPQNCYEFWVVATRPVTNNGLGLSTAECDQMLGMIEAAFPMFDDKPMMVADWRKLVITHDCKGKVAHDTRLVAAMQKHGVTQLLSFNVADFTRYTGITVLDPNVVAASASKGANP